ncbi:CBS domain-containing protein [Archaeoglobus veneficus]|uniref:Putative signal transduction protein with CBS domains n=1 Tax=Archaeoglobus veneficus (strain DSM 11195 / SNP6) TaxID=693661 RepID=F2KS64_ARCVS|nr:CBS domain-containing protein [Archaeoglobus veneficus]AEA48003.1 putative signal transduction protein with CBS domains [Archaeoglobus veneficus SNP6]
MSEVEMLKSLIREDYEVVDANETISKIVPMIEKLEPDKASAILVQENGNIIGVIRERDLMRGCLMVNPHETKIKNFAIRTGVIDASELSVEKVARRFVEDSTPFVLVRSSGKHGVIYINDFLELVKPEFEGVKAREVMNPEVITINEYETAAKALATMRNHGIDRLVVVDDSHRAVGIITGKDIIDRVISPKREARLGGGSGETDRSLSVMVGSIMSYPIVTADRNDSIAKVIDLMIENKISSIVITKDSIPEGIVIKKDILESLIRKKAPAEYEVQLITKDIVLDDFDRKAIVEDLEKFMRKFKDFLGESVLFVYIKRHKENFRGLPLIHVRIKLSSEKGTFFVTGESWGIEYALHATLKKLERSVLQQKELLLDQRMVKKFYEEIL